MKQLSWILLLSLSLTGAATAAPRWGDDFDWLGDTLAITVPMGMIGFGDTLVCRTPTSMFAMLQTSNTTFQKLWQLNVPVTADAPYFNWPTREYAHIVRNGNRFYYGWPRAMIEWNGSDPPIYRGAVRNGITFVPDTNFTALSEGLGMYYQRDYRPEFHDNLLFLTNQLYTQDSTGTLNFTGFTNDDTARFTDHAVRWPYAYRVSFNNAVLSVVKLDSTPIHEVFRMNIRSPYICKIINDTLLTIWGQYWQVWSLQNPRIPQLITTDTLPRPIYHLWDEPVDSVWFGWGRWSFDDYSKQAFCLLSLDSGLTAPTIVDSLVEGNRYGCYFGNYAVSPANVTRLDRGWLVRLPNDDYSPGLGSHFAQLRQYRDAFNRQRLDTLWYYRQPTGFDSTYLADEQYFDGRGGTTTWSFAGKWGKNGRAIIQRGYRYAQLVADTVNAHHEIRWLPQSLIPFGHYGDQVIAKQSPYHDSLFHLLTWTNGQWVDQTMPVPDSAGNILFFRQGQLVTYTFNTVIPYQVYQIENGNLVFDGMIYPPANSWRIHAFRGENAIVSRNFDLNRDSLLWYRKVGNEWSQQNWHAIDSDDHFVNLQTDSLFSCNQSIYVLPEHGEPYLELELNPIQHCDIYYNRSLLQFQLRLTNSAYQNIYSRIDHTWQGWVERGYITSGIPFLYYGSILLTNSPGAISTYRMPPNNATLELIGTLPFDFALSNPYPNPFNSTISFHVDLPRSAITEYAIYDALGRDVYTQPSEHLSPGSYTLHWNGHDNSGLPASSGVYFVQVRAGTFTDVKKVIMLK